MRGCLLQLLLFVFLATTFACSNDGDCHIRAYCDESSTCVCNTGYTGTGISCGPDCSDYDVTWTGCADSGGVLGPSCYGLSWDIHSFTGDSRISYFNIYQDGEYIGQTDETTFNASVYHNYNEDLSFHVQAVNECGETTPLDAALELVVPGTGSGSAMINATVGAVDADESRTGSVQFDIYTEGYYHHWRYSLDSLNETCTTGGTAVCSGTTAVVSGLYAGTYTAHFMLALDDGTPHGDTYTTSFTLVAYPEIVLEVTPSSPPLRTGMGRALLSATLYGVYDSWRYELSTMPNNTLINSTSVTNGDSDVEFILSPGDYHVWASLVRDGSDIGFPHELNFTVLEFPRIVSIINSNGTANETLLGTNTVELEAVGDFYTWHWQHNDPFNTSEVATGNAVPAGTFRITIRDRSVGDHLVSYALVDEAANIVGEQVSSNYTIYPYPNITSLSVTTFAANETGAGYACIDIAAEGWYNSWQALAVHEDDGIAQLSDSGAGGGLPAMWPYRTCLYDLIPGNYTLAVGLDDIFGQIVSEQRFAEFTIDPYPAITSLFVDPSHVMVRGGSGSVAFDLTTIGQWSLWGYRLEVVAYYSSRRLLSYEDADGVIPNTIRDSGRTAQSVASAEAYEAPPAAARRLLATPTFPVVGNNTAEVLAYEITDLPPGRYRLTVWLMDETGLQVGESVQVEFEILPFPEILEVVTSGGTANAFGFGAAGFDMTAIGNFGGWQYSLTSLSTDVANGTLMNANETTTVLTDLPAGFHFFEVGLLDPDGNPIGDIFTANYTVLFYPEITDASVMPYDANSTGFGYAVVSVTATGNYSHYHWNLGSPLGSEGTLAQGTSSLDTETIPSLPAGDYTVHISLVDAGEVAVGLPTSVDFTIDPFPEITSLSVAGVTPSDSASNGTVQIDLTTVGNYDQWRYSLVDLSSGARATAGVVGSGLGTQVGVYPGTFNVTVWLVASNSQVGASAWDSVVVLEYPVVTNATATGSVADATRTGEVTLTVEARGDYENWQYKFSTFSSPPSLAGGADVLSSSVVVDAVSEGTHTVYVGLVDTSGYLVGDVVTVDVTVGVYPHFESISVDGSVANVDDLGTATLTVDPQGVFDHWQYSLSGLTDSGVQTGTSVLEETEVTLEDLSSGDYTVYFVLVDEDNSALGVVETRDFTIQGYPTITNMELAATEEDETFQGSCDITITATGAYDVWAWSLAPMGDDSETVVAEGLTATVTSLAAGTYTIYVQLRRDGSFVGAEVSSDCTVDPYPAITSVDVSTEEAGADDQGVVTFVLTTEGVYDHVQHATSASGPWTDAASTTIELTQSSGSRTHYFRLVDEADGQRGDTSSSSYDILPYPSVDSLSLTPSFADSPEDTGSLLVTITTIGVYDEWRYSVDNVEALGSHESPIPDASAVTDGLSVSVSGISPGVHVLYAALCDSSGNQRGDVVSEVFNIKLQPKVLSVSADPVGENMWGYGYANISVTTQGEFWTWRWSLDSELESSGDAGGTAVYNTTSYHVATQLLAGDYTVYVGLCGESGELISSPQQLSTDFTVVPFPEVTSISVVSLPSASESTAAEVNVTIEAIGPFDHWHFSNSNFSIPGVAGGVHVAAGETLGQDDTLFLPGTRTVYIVLVDADENIVSNIHFVEFSVVESADAALIAELNFRLYDDTSADLDLIVTDPNEEWYNYQVFTHYTQDSVDTEAPDLVYFPGSSDSSDPPSGTYTILVHMYDTNSISGDIDLSLEVWMRGQFMSQLIHATISSSHAFYSANTLNPPDEAKVVTVSFTYDGSCTNDCAYSVDTIWNEEYTTQVS